MRYKYDRQWDATACLYQSHDDFSVMLTLEVGIDSYEQLVLRKHREDELNGEDSSVFFYASAEETASLAAQIGCQVPELPEAFYVGFTTPPPAEQDEEDDSELLRKIDLGHVCKIRNEAFYQFLDYIEEPPRMAEEEVEEDDPFDSFDLKRCDDILKEVIEYLISQGMHMHKSKIIHRLGEDAQKPFTEDTVVTFSSEDIEVDPTDSMY